MYRALNWQTFPKTHEKVEMSEEKKLPRAQILRYFYYKSRNNEQLNKLLQS